MCGIAGLLSKRQSSDELTIGGGLRAMAGAIAHRGPDAEGFWIDPQASVGLAHRRLSILDLSLAGAQPMVSASGRFVILFNGEIYNHVSLREELQHGNDTAAWHGHSDTETLLLAIERWGLKKALERAFGMFALAVWDKEEQRLSLARDRTGEKPLYLAEVNGGWAFASELAAFHHLPGFKAQLDPQALREYIATLVVPDSACVFQGVRKIRPGTILYISAADGTVEEDYYFDMVDVMTSGRDAAKVRLVSGNASESHEIEAILRDVVISQMISDVPLGSFLSGGIDSSLVTALMQEASDRPVKTFTIGFAEPGYDESSHAERVADHLGTDHVTFRISEADVLDIIPHLPRIYSEPFADSSQLPTALLCARARHHVTVVLTGDGGDEIFGGYNRHVLGPKLWSLVTRIPRCLRAMAAPLAKNIACVGGEQSPFLRGLARCTGIPASLLDKAGRLGEIVASVDTIEDCYAALTRSTDVAEKFFRKELDGHRNSSLRNDPRLIGLSVPEWMMAQDSLGYLPSDVLVKVDRAAMSVSLETRAPFLDIRVVEAAWKLPVSAKIRGDQGKKILRELLQRRVPAILTDRPKQGFAVPIDRWLRGELREWAGRLLSRDALSAGSLLNVESVEEIWSSHLSGTKNHGNILWAILMLQAWIQEWDISPAE